MAVNFLSLSLASLQLPSLKELVGACSQLTEAPWAPILSSVFLISGHSQLGHDPSDIALTTLCGILDITNAVPARGCQMDWVHQSICHPTDGI